MKYLDSKPFSTGPNSPEYRRNYDAAFVSAGASPINAVWGALCDHTYEPWLRADCGCRVNRCTNCENYEHPDECPDHPRPPPEDLPARLRKRAEIRRSISTRKSVQEGKPDRIADLLDEAATALESPRMTIAELVEQAHANAVNKGFWPPAMELTEHALATKLCLIHSEVSEALEEIRKPRTPANSTIPLEPDEWVCINGKPEGFAVELADAVVRIADLCGALHIDLAAVLAEKMAYNATRPTLHGGNF